MGEMKEKEYQTGIKPFPFRFWIEYEMAEAEKRLQARRSGAISDVEDILFLAWSRIYEKKKLKRTGPVTCSGGYVPR